MMCACRRQIFNGWDPEEPKPKRAEWRTSTFFRLSKIASMHSLRSGVVGWGCCRLVNVTKAKPAETAVFAVPPAVAVLRTRPEGDTQLKLSFHIAVIHQVRARPAAAIPPALLSKLPCVHCRTGLC